MAYILSVSPTKVSHRDKARLKTIEMHPQLFFSELTKGWREVWREIIGAGLKSAERNLRESYFRNTNKINGKLIRSRHISEMLKIDTGEIRGSPRAGDQYSLTAYLKSDESPKWDSIALAHEEGKTIRPTSSKVLTIPNRRAGISSSARASDFKNARWINIRGRPFLVESEKVSKPKVARKPPGPTKARGHKKPIPKTYKGRRILFLGAKQVTLPARHFFRNAMESAANKIRREFPNELKSMFERL